MDKDNKLQFTSAQTDSESGNEGVSVKDETRKHNDALKKMFEMGLMSEDEYKAKLK